MNNTILSLSKKARKRMRRAELQAQLAGTFIANNQEKKVPVVTGNNTLGAWQPKWEATVTNQAGNTQNQSALINQGKPGVAQTNQGKAGRAQTNQGKPGVAQTNQGKAGVAQTNQGKPGVAQTNIGKAGVAQTNQGKAGIVQPNQVKPGVAQTNQGKAGPIPTIQGKPGVNQGKAGAGPGETKATWENFQTKVVRSRKKKGGYRVIYKLAKDNDQGAKTEESEQPKDQGNQWQPVDTAQTTEGQANTGQEVKQTVTKFEMNRPNTKVVEGKAASIQLNLDKSKGLMVEKAKESPKPTQQVEAAKPPSGPTIPNPARSQPTQGVKSLMSTPVSKPVLPIQQKKPTGFQGRATASSFMRQAGNGPPGVNYPQIRFPAGIPKSFLINQNEQNMLQQEQNSNQNAASNQNAKGPVWEAQTGRSATWTPVQRDQSGQAMDQSGPMFDQSGQIKSSEQQMFVQTDNVDGQPRQQYSPSDAYADMVMNEENEELQDDSMSLDSHISGSKRLSAFQRLGPVTQAKKPKLTINLLFNKEQAVRKVVDETEENIDPEKYTPAYLKPDVQTSLDDTVIKYLLCWPWKKHFQPRRTVTARHSKSVMMMELEQMEEAYERDSMFLQVSVTGYPESWSKEDVLDAVLESVKGKSFIPCFIEFARDECKFLVIRSRAALTAIHKYGFVINKEDVKLTLSIMQITIGVQQIDFIPRLVLRKRLLMAMEGETELNLTEFTTKSDVSHFIYFPLNRVCNQAELIHLPSSVPWENLTKLDLSHNRITTLSGFDLPHYTPRLKHLDISYNHIEGITALLPCRELPLNSIALEGNPLCTDYIQQERYIKVLKMIFPELKEIDGVKLTIAGSFPKWHRNYSTPEAQPIVEKVLEVLFPLLDADPEERQRCEDLYDVNAVMTITYMYKIRYGPIYKEYRALFSRARAMAEGDLECISGATDIGKVVYRWPRLHHDPTTFTVDLIYHTDTTTIFKVSGILRVTTESLADDEHLLSFTRTIVINSIDSIEFKITNEMIYWDLPDKDTAQKAFRMTTGRSNNVSLKLESPPNDELKEKLLQIFMKLTEMERKPSERCLEMKEWHLKNALEYFSKLLKLDDLSPLY